MANELKLSEMLTKEAESTVLANEQGIRTSVSQEMLSVYDIGKRLCHNQEIFDAARKGSFKRRVKQTGFMSPQTAYRYMGAYRFFQSHGETDLKTVGKFDISAIYELIKESASSKTIAFCLAQAKGGSKVTKQVVLTQEKKNTVEPSKGSGEQSTEEESEQNKSSHADSEASDPEPSSTDCQRSDHSTETHAPSPQQSAESAPHVSESAEHNAASDSATAIDGTGKDDQELESDAVSSTFVCRGCDKQIQVLGNDSGGFAFCSIKCFREHQASLDEVPANYKRCPNCKGLGVVDEGTAKPKTSGRFKPPTVAEVAAYCRERSNNVDPEQFVDFYESKGWIVGKNKMKDWQASVRTWEKRNSSPAKEESIIERKKREMGFDE